jgi:peptide deformylase
MAVLEIKTFPADVLKRKAEPVKDMSEKGLQQLIDDMIDTMHDAPGIGLAAPQVGVSKRLIVLDLSTQEQQMPVIVLINPEIVSAEGMIESEEGCLSIPECVVTVGRAERVKVQGLDRQGTPVVIEADGLLARALQHEIDHLEGLVLFDRLNSVKREFIKKRYLKALKKGSLRGD